MAAGRLNGPLTAFATGVRTPIDVYCSDSGEGKHRAPSHKRTYQFNSQSDRFDVKSGPQLPTKKIGPGSYFGSMKLEPGGSGDTVSNWCRGDRLELGRAISTATKSAKEEADMPGPHFNIEDEDRRYWKGYSAPATFKKTRRFSSDGLFVNEMGPGSYRIPGDPNEYDIEATSAHTSLRSATPKFQEFPVEGPQYNQGPGQYGIPPHPDWQWGAERTERTAMGDTPLDGSKRMNASFRKHHHQPRLSKKDRYGDDSENGPGANWTRDKPPHLTQVPERLRGKGQEAATMSGTFTRAHSVLGTAGMLAVGRTEKLRAKGSTPPVGHYCPGPPGAVKRP
jgi:hypothetical protein